MSQNTLQALSAFVYELENRFLADCSVLNLICSGLTPDEAVDNLKNEIKNNLNSQEFHINTVYERR